MNESYFIFKLESHFVQGISNKQFIKSKSSSGRKREITNIGWGPTPVNTSTGHISFSTI